MVASWGRDGAEWRVRARVRTGDPLPNWRAMMTSIAAIVSHWERGASLFPGGFRCPALRKSLPKFALVFALGLVAACSLATIPRPHLGLHSTISGAPLRPGQGTRV